MTRGERIVLLVWSMGDAAATPSSGRGELRRPAATRRDACPRCDGIGTVQGAFRRQVECPTCEGRGMVWVDGYTGERTGAPGSAAPAPAEVATFRRRIGCAWCQEGLRSRWDPVRETWLPIERRSETLPRGTGVRAGKRCGNCDGTGWEWVSAELEVPGQARNGSVERVAWRIAGSYAELARALEKLRAWGPAAYHDLVQQGSRGVWPLSGIPAEEGLEFVSRLMPARIVVSGDVLVAWRARKERSEQIRGARRDLRIRELVSEGVPPAVVARRAGLSESQVRRIAYGRNVA